MMYHQCIHIIPLFGKDGYFIGKYIKRIYMTKSNCVRIALYAVVSRNFGVHYKSAYQKQITASRKSKYRILYFLALKD